MYLRGSRYTIRKSSSYKRVGIRTLSTNKRKEKERKEIVREGACSKKHAYSFTFINCCYCGVPVSTATKQRQEYLLCFINTVPLVAGLVCLLESKYTRNERSHHPQTSHILVGVSECVYFKRKYAQLTRLAKGIARSSAVQGKGTCEYYIRLKQI